MSYPYYSDVERAFNELRAEGKIMPRPSGSPQIDQDKGLLTQRSGYYSNLKDATIGVLEKTSGNNYQGYSVDILIRTDGTYWDIASDRELGNGMAEAYPVNGGPATDPELIPRWKKPSAELAQVDPDAGGGDGGNGGDGGDGGSGGVDRTDEILVAIADSEARIMANVTAQGEETRALIEKFADQVDYWAGIIAAVWLQNQTPGAGDGGGNGGGIDIGGPGQDSDLVTLIKARKLIERFQEAGNGGILGRRR